MSTILSPISIVNNSPQYRGAEKTGSGDTSPPTVAAVVSSDNPILPKRKWPTLIQPGPFDRSKHFYERSLKAKMHPIVKQFLELSTEERTQRYCELYPSVDRAELTNLLSYVPSHLFWAGVDLLNMQSASESLAAMTILETNSCPSGQKSVPRRNDTDEGGYESLMRAFLGAAAVFEPAKEIVSGVLAAIYDKNVMEVSGYAKQLANLSGENVYLVELYDDDLSPCARWNENSILEVLCSETNTWLPVRAAFRYVTQRPWNRVPVNSHTFIFNSTLACLAGGRNKLMGQRAYEALNTEISASGLSIRLPRTVTDVQRRDMESVVESMDYRVVIKIPYSNAGQGVFTIHSRAEFDAFMEEQIACGNIDYQLFIVQELLVSRGTMPEADQSGNIFVWDLRFMIHTTAEGYRPAAMYARKAAVPLNPSNTECDSRSMYLTNLSEKLGKNSWGTDVDRLVVLSEDDFDTLGLTIDGLLDGYIQAVLASIAIDKMATRLVRNEVGLEGKSFDRDLFKSLNDDQTLLNEIYEV